MITNSSNYNESRIIALIFISDSDITAQNIFASPKLISRVSSIHTQELLYHTYKPNDTYIGEQT